jgi:hypothetical protein
MQKLDTVGAILALESEEGGDEVEAMQALINSGHAWTLQGSTGRACMQAIRDGVCALGATDHIDAYGNHVPSRFQVKAGTAGKRAC